MDACYRIFLEWLPNKMRILNDVPKVAYSTKLIRIVSNNRKRTFQASNMFFCFVAQRLLAK